jgi:small subunit ribosomal protein S14
MSLFMTKLPRNGVSTRARNRDIIDAHPRAYFRKYGASRHTISELQRNGYIPGLFGASW